MTGNEEEVARIMEMTETELLDYVIETPDYLSDPYYRVFGKAIRARHAQLRGGGKD